MPTATKIAIIAAGLAVGSMFDAPASNASGDAPWCAVTEIGEGAEAWDCQYRAVEECVPNVLAGNRGRCSPNPYAVDLTTVSVPATGPTSNTTNRAANRKLQKDATAPAQVSKKSGNCIGAADRGQCRQVAGAFAQAVVA